MKSQAVLNVNVTHPTIFVSKDILHRQHDTTVNRYLDHRQII